MKKKMGRSKKVTSDGKKWETYKPRKCDPEY